MRCPPGSISRASRSLDGAVAAPAGCRGSPPRSAAGSSVWIKREDLLPLAFGGNKLRNLEFLVGAALAEGADTLVTSGRRWSNHCSPDRGRRGPGRARRPPRAVGAARRPARTRASRSTSCSARRSTSWRPRIARSGRRLVERVVAELRAAGRRPYVIGVGWLGSARGATGQVLARARARSRRPTADRGLRRRRRSCRRRRAGPRPVSSSATARRRGSRGRSSGVVVARPEAELRPAIEAPVAELGRAGRDRDRAARRHRARRHPARDGLRPPDRRPPTEAAALLARTEGILVDPIYTAKALAGAHRQGRGRGPRRPDRRVLARRRHARAVRAAGLRRRPSRPRPWLTPRRTATRRGSSSGPPSGGPRRRRPAPRSRNSDVDRRRA